MLPTQILTGTCAAAPHARRTQMLQEGAGARAPPQKVGAGTQDLHWCLGVCAHFCVRPMVFLMSSLVRVGIIRCVHTRVQTKLTQLWVAQW